ncbi:hypothetical protein AGMMS50212_15440 [Spirochaetia bacterium]|nr:hypothetical protein AGMMS50212_15440 [Spirochaetia bacterium]
MEMSNLQKSRYNYKPKLPDILSGSIHDIGIELGGATEAFADNDELKTLFKHSYGKPVATFVRRKNDAISTALKIGVILSGGQAPGGHNVIAGIFDGLKKANPESKLFGFKGGPSGLINGKHVEITAEIMDKYRNTGGFDIIGSGRTKIETPEQFVASMENAHKLDINAIVIIGGDDSNTNAALLAEYFIAHNSHVQVVGCPKTIDGDLKNQYIETSFGFAAFYGVCL